MRFHLNHHCCVFAKQKFYQVLFTDIAQIQVQTQVVLSKSHFEQGGN